MQMTEHEMLETGLRILKEYGIRAEIEILAPAGHGADATIRLEIGPEDRLFDVTCKKWLTPEHLGVVTARLKEGRNPGFLIAGRVTRPMAERLRELGIPYLDMAGNAWLELPPVVLRVEGRKPPGTPGPPARNRAFQPSGLRVVFALLCRPGLFKAPLREIAKMTGVAHGTVRWVMHGLGERGYLIERGKGRGQKRAPRNLLALLDEWAGEYARNLRPRLLLGRYTPGPRTPDDWWRAATGTYGTLLGGEPAAALLNAPLQPGAVTMYANRLPGKLIAANRLEKDERGTIEFRQRFWLFDVDPEYPVLVPHPLIYADLLATGEPRCVETARIIHERHLAGPLGQY